MNDLILLTIALIALVGALCTLIYTKQAEMLKQMKYQKQSLDMLESSLADTTHTQSKLAKRIDQLATDVLQREIYQSADDRHQLAIQSAKQGKTLIELIQRHGLSSDEAALILSLHAPKARDPDAMVQNANLVDPSIADVV